MLCALFSGVFFLFLFYFISLSLVCSFPRQFYYSHGSLQGVVMDIWNTRWPIGIIGFVGAIVMGFAWIMFVRVVICPIVWGTIIVLITVFAVCGAWSLLKAQFFDTTQIMHNC